MSVSRLVAVAALLLLGACQTAGSAGLGSAVQPDELIGRDSVGVVGALGQPTRVRKEASAQIWQYDGGSCVVDLFLYPEGAQHRVAYIEARDTAQGHKADAARCLTQVQSATRSS